MSWKWLRCLLSVLAIFTATFSLFLFSLYQYAGLTTYSRTSHAATTSVRAGLVDRSRPVVQSGAPPALEPLVAIVAVVDVVFRKAYLLQLATQRAYAQRHGYTFTLVDPEQFPQCRRKHHFRRHDLPDFFFVKHCVVRAWLAVQIDGYTAVILDSDVVAGAPEISMDNWLQEPGDLIFYERVRSRARTMLRRCPRVCYLLIPLLPACASFTVEHSIVRT